MEKELLKKKTVLIADDFETNTFVVGLTLENANYFVIKVENGINGHSESAFVIE